MTHLSLFSGIGGLDLAAEWAGFQTVGQCEWADYPTKVLEKHWPDVPKWRDIRDLSAKSFRERTGIDRPTIISGGFPCQPFSVAGKQKGKGDDRYLWPEMLRVIRELAPGWVVGENVPGIMRIAADDVCKDLERIGYDVGVFNFEAASVGALHPRARIAFVANSRLRRCGGQEDACQQQGGANAFRPGEAFTNTNRHTWNTWRPEPAGQQRQAGIANGGDDVANADSVGFSVERQRSGVDAIRAGRENVEFQAAQQSQGWGGGHWAVEPDVGRVAHGIPSRVDRLRTLGNAVVPQQAYPIFRAIAEIQRKK